MSNVAQTIAVIGGLGALLGLVVGLQTFWIARALERLDVRLDRIETTFLKDHGERLARLEERDRARAR